MFPWWGWVLVAIAILSFFVTPLFDSNGGREGSPVSSETELMSAPGLGDTQETIDGIAITPLSFSYNAPTPESYLIGEPLGSYATVTFRIENQSNEPHRLSSRQATGTIGGAEYDATGLTFPDGERLGILQNINPGLSLEVIAYFDIPPGATFDTFNYESSRITGSKISFILR
jgi:hypothetical protein